MVDRAQSDQDHRETPTPQIRKPGILLFIFGVAYPAIVVGFELITRMCAQFFFDTMPTPLHAVLIAAVPIGNLALWIMLRREQAPSRWWVLAGGVASAIAFCYVLVFLPLYPIAVIGVVFYGLGLLPFGPLAAFVSALLLTFRTNARAGGASARAWAGAALGLIAINALDISPAATRLALRWAASENAETRRNGVALMRWAGDRNLLLRLCYDSSGRPSGVLSALAASWTWFEGGGATFNSTEQARELYYRVTGDPYNSAAPPYTGGPWSFARAFEFDEDQGGAEVGGRVRGLRLAASRIDASIDADDAVGYLEWTMEFANFADTASEARLTLALPPGGVISRATLWVNGVPREAAVASRAAVRRAYEAVVRRQRDPLLVTTQGADRALVQAFPILPGETLKLRIGVTTPLALPSGDSAALVLPAIVDRNFSIDQELRHAIWIEGDGGIASAHQAFSRANRLGEFRARAMLDDATLARQRPRVVATRSAGATVSYSPAVVAPDRAPPGAQSASATQQQARPEARDPNGPPLIMQTIEPAMREAPGAIMIVVDGSRRAAPAFPAASAALAQIPDHAIVGLIVASAVETLRIDPAPTNEEHRARLVGMLSRARAQGGQDNVSALADAIAALDPFDNAALVWIHGPQPVAFARDSAGLEQTLDRSTRLPRFVLYPVSPGPNLVLQDQDWFWRANTAAASGNVEADLTELLRGLYARSEWRSIRTEAPAGATATNSSGHIARLWANERIVRLAADPEAREEAIKLAAAYRLVTPVSGAVVLETDADYARNDLAAPDASQIPTVPEPAAWMMLLIACVLLALIARRNRQLLFFKAPAQ